jgi:hypothetical protein
VDNKPDTIEELYKERDTILKAAHMTAPDALRLAAIQEKIDKWESVYQTNPLD